MVVIGVQGGMFGLRSGGVLVFVIPQVLPENPGYKNSHPVYRLENGRINSDE
jgi:hypothetical protein